MKTIVLMVLLCFCPLSGIAQNNAVIGQVSDSLDNGVPLVHVMIFKGDTFVLGTVTNFEGSFAIDNLEYGSYLLKIVAIGYADFNKLFTHQGGPTDLGILQLKTSSIELDGVELIGRKKLYERRANSLIINAEQNIASSGGSALDLLGNTAGVSVNQQSGSLALHGKGHITIMVNGKPNRVDGQALIGMLKAIPASDIKSLEVFNNPPAKHEANGSGGMINIMTRSKHGNSQGGSVSLITGSGEGEKTGASSNFNYKYGKIGLFGNYSFNRNRSPEEWALESEFNNSSARKIVTAHSLRKPVTVSQNYMFGIDYDLGMNTEVGGSVSGYSRKWDMVAQDNVIRGDAGNEIETLDIETNEINNWRHISGNFHVVQSLGESHRLIFDYDHLYYNDDNPSNYQIDSQGEADLIETRKKTPINFNVYNLGYSGKVSNTVQLDFGAKATYSNFTNRIEISSLTGGNIFIDNELSSFTRMKERIHAFYSSFHFQFGGKSDLTTGLRFEYTDNTLESDEGVSPVTNRKYGNFFPNLAFTYQFNDVHRLQINYSRRINRPTFNQMAPFVLFLGPDALYSGNANLQPAFVNKYGIQWSWIGKNISLEYQTEKDAIVEFQPRLSENGAQYIFRAENMDQRKILSASLSVPLRIAPWWEAESNVTFLYETLRFNFQAIEYNRNKGSFRASASQQFSLGENTKLEISGYYQSPTLQGISTFGAMGSVNLGIRQQLRKNYGTLQLTFTNVLASENWKVRTNTSQPFVRTFETYFPESRIVALTYTKSFGGKRKEVKFNGNGADEEKKRVQ